MAYPFSTIQRQSRVGILINTRERDGVRAAKNALYSQPCSNAYKVEFPARCSAVTEIVNV